MSKKIKWMDVMWHDSVHPHPQCTILGGHIILYYTMMACYKQDGKPVDYFILEGKNHLLQLSGDTKQNAKDSCTEMY